MSFKCNGYILFAFYKANLVVKENDMYDSKKVSLKYMNAYFMLL